MTVLRREGVPKILSTWCVLGHQFDVTITTVDLGPSSNRSFSVLYALIIELKPYVAEN